MSIQAVAWAIDQKTGSAAGKVVLLCLANYADDEGKCWPKQETIALETELSERSVREWLQKLEESGLISREHRRRDDGYRASDMIHLAFKNQPAKSAGKANSHRQIAPTLPEPVAAPTSFEPSLEPSAAARGRADLDKLRDQMLEAVGEENIQGHGVHDLSAIIGLLEGGCHLETDILPAIRAKSARLTRPVRSWAYFVDAIRDAHNRRVESGKGLVLPKPSPKVDASMSPDEMRRTWAGRLNFARSRAIWLTWLHGPPPGREGCRVPPDLLEARDSKIDWSEEQQPQAA